MWYMNTWKKKNNKQKNSKTRQFLRNKAGGCLSSLAGVGSKYVSSTKMRVFLTEMHASELI